MLFQFKRRLKFGLIVVGLVLAPPFLWGGTIYAPTRDGGNFGLGLELGDPGNWGITGKFWVDHKNAFQGAVKFPGGAALLQLDYLWHDFGLIHMRNPDGEMPFYIGVGGNLTLQSPASLAARLPIGLSYIFDKKNVPVDLYLQVVPTLWFYNGGATFDFYPEFGAHYYF